jgi:hypothetical protein
MAASSCRVWLPNGSAIATIVAAAMVVRSADPETFDANPSTGAA